MVGNNFVIRVRVDFPTYFPFAGMETLEFPQLLQIRRDFSPYFPFAGMETLGHIPDCYHHSITTFLPTSPSRGWKRY